jgi:hypothetical protein
MKGKISTEMRVGDWVYHPRTLVVRYRKGGFEYEVDLEQCTTPAEMLSWIFQFANKTWATRESVGDLVKILSRLLRPKHNLCLGRSLPEREALCRLIAKHIKEQQVMDLHEQRWKAKHPGSSFINITPVLLEGLKELEPMPHEAGLGDDKAKAKNRGRQLRKQ